MKFLSTSLLSLSLLFLSQSSTLAAVLPHQVNDSQPQNVNSQTLKIPGVNGDNVDPTDKNATSISNGPPTPIPDSLRTSIHEFLPYAGASYCTS